MASPVMPGHMPANFIVAQATPLLGVQSQVLIGKHFDTSPPRKLYARVQAPPQPPAIRFALSDAVPQQAPQQVRPLYAPQQQQAPSQWQAVQASMFKSYLYSDFT
jgi:hypothetical protein